MIDKNPMDHNEDARVPTLNKSATDAGVVPSHGISMNLPDVSDDGRPIATKHMSLPSYQSPLRHHRRTASHTRHVKETLNARSHYSSSDDDGTAVHRINQYIIKQEIGRGSFGAVHLAVDQYGVEYAVKEFSKARLRKRAQSNLLRRPNQKRQSGHSSARMGFNSPLHRLSSSDRAEQQENHALDLIKEEIAIMKKLNHNNVVSLIEVLDDPEEDSLYMVLEMCKKGVSMKVGLDETAEPYDEETCRCWFRDMILGIEYLHERGIVHRDIKPDNCLITQDDVLKIVDFGVSEMFEKQSDMATAKSAGSPAFMPPELCVAKHGQVSGRAADIWSMGATLYCLRYGKIPFEKHGMLELYESIRRDEVDVHEEANHDFADLIRRLLCKDPERRITMEKLRDHPWVTKKGTDPLLSAEENCSDIVELPTAAEMEHAITGNMKQLLVVMKAVKRFKHLLFSKRPELMEGIFGRSSKLVAPPSEYKRTDDDQSGGSRKQRDHRRVERDTAAKGGHNEDSVSDELENQAKSTQKSGKTSDSEGEGEEASTMDTPVQADHAKGHAHDPLTDVLFLDIGPDSDSLLTKSGAEHLISESPGAADMNVYEAAYEAEMQRILVRRGKTPTIYLTRRVEGNKAIREHESIIKDDSKAEASGLAGLVQRAKAYDAKEKGDDDDDDEEEKHENIINDESKLEAGGLAGLVQRAKVHDAKEREDDDEEERHKKEDDATE